MLLWRVLLDWMGILTDHRAGRCGARAAASRAWVSGAERGAVGADPAAAASLGPPSTSPTDSVQCLMNSSECCYACPFLIKVALSLRQLVL